MWGELHGKLSVRQTEGVQERPNAVGAHSSLENKRISHRFTIDILLGPAAWSL